MVDQPFALHQSACRYKASGGVAPLAKCEQQPFACRLREPGGQGARTGKVACSADGIGEGRSDVAFVRDLATQAALVIE